MAIVTKYAESQTTVNVVRFDEDTLLSQLKPEVYSVGFDQMTGFFLTKETHRLKTPSTVYGPMSRRVDKVMDGFTSCTRSFGVLFSGDKGSGKTMQSSLIANRAMDELGIPTILINDTFDTEGLSDFIQRLGECVLFFDEFGKRYKSHESEQDGLLSVFDGTGNDRRLILLTENNERMINEYMLNRPGRLHYHFRHRKLDEEVIREYCSEFNVPGNTIEQICLVRESSVEFSFDTLQSIVSEWTKYGGDVNELIVDLNVEQPIDFNRDMIEIKSVASLDSNEKFEIVQHDSEFPSASFTPFMVFKSLDSDKKDSFHLGVKDIVKRAGNLFTFVVELDNGVRVKIEATKKERTFDDYAF